VEATVSALRWLCILFLWAALDLVAAPILPTLVEAGEESSEEAVHVLRAGRRRPEGSGSSRAVFDEPACSTPRAASVAVAAARAPAARRLAVVRKLPSADRDPGPSPDDH